MIPPVDPLTGLAVIRRPAEIGGVDIGGQPFLEPMQLIGTDEMHLAREASLVSRPAQVMGIGGDIGGKLGSIVINARAGRQKARNETGAAWGAERAGGVAIGKAR